MRRYCGGSDRGATVLGIARQITGRDLRTGCAAILREVERGVTLVVTRGDTPIAQLRPIGGPRFVAREQLMRSAAAAPRIDARRFRADLDGGVDARVDG